MKRKAMLTIATVGVALAIVGGRAISARDKDTLRIPKIHWKATKSTDAPAPTIVAKKDYVFTTYPKR